jgi:Ca2+-binding RTX toxin-like protein
LNDFSNMTADATYGAAATTFNQKAANSQALSQTAGTATGTYAAVSTTAAAVVFPLTTGADVKTMGSGADTINGLFSSATGMTFQGTDSLDGGAGADTINIQVGVTGTHGAASMANIETVSANFSAAGTVSLLNSTGVTTVESSASTAAAAFSNIGSTSTALKVSNTAQDATFGYTTAAVAGTADTVALTLSGVTGGTVTLAGVETVGITSSGSANTLTGLTATSATTVNVAGDQALALGTLGATVTTLNAGSNTATGTGVSATLGASLTATVTGGSGNDAINISAVTGNVNLTGGAGNDTVTVTSNLTVTDTIGGGDGIADVLSTTAAIAEGYLAPTTRTITGFEQLTLSTAGTAAATLTTANVDTGITRVNLAGTGGAYGVTGPAGALTVTTTAALGGTLTLTDTGTAITDAATLTNSGVTVGVDVLAGRAVTSTGYETLNVNVGSGSTTNAATQTLGAVTVTVDTGGASVVNFTGGNSVSTGAISAATINASALTGSSTFTMASATGATSITGTANNDSIGASSVASSVDGGAGNDTITGGTLNDTLVGGDGNDSITGGRGKDSITGGAGVDTFRIDQPTVAAVTSTIGAPDVITDFVSGTDKLSLGQTVTAFLGNYSNFTIAQTAANADGRGNLAYFVTGENNLYVQASTNGGINVNTDTVVTLSNVTSLTGADLLLGAQGTGNTVVLVAGAIPVVNTTASNATNSVLTTAQDDTISAVTGATAAATSLIGTGAAIDGGLGNDTLNITASADAQVTSLVTAGTNGVAVTNVETVNLTVTATAAANALGTLPATLTTLTATGTDSNGAITATVGATGQTITVTNTAGTTGSTITFGNFPGTAAGVATQTVTTGTAGDTFNTIAVDGINVNGGAGDDTFNISNAAAFDDDSLMITITGGTGTDAITFANALITTTATVNLADTTDVSISGVETLNAGAVSVDARAVVLSVTMPAGTAFRTISGTTAAAGGLNIGSDDITFTATAAQIDALTTITSGSANGVFSVASSDTAGPITVNLADTTYTIANIDSITFASVTTGVVTVTIDENVAVVGGSGNDVLNVTADLGNVTLAASAFETVNLNAVQATILTIANTATTVNATAGGVVILGTGGDTFNNSGAVAATVTGGSGVDTINHSGTTTLSVSDSPEADVINVTGTGALTFFGSAATGGGITTINLPSNSTVDNIYFTSAATTGTPIALAVDRIVVTGFNTSADRIHLDGDVTTGATANGSAALIQVVSAAPTATVTFNSANDFLLFNFDMGGTAEQLSGDVGGTALLAALGQTLAITTTAHKGYVGAFDNGFLYIYQLIEDGDGDANVDDAADLILVGRINAEVGSIGTSDIFMAGTA